MTRQGIDENYRAVPCKIAWEGSYYYIQTYVEGEWTSGKLEEGWELVTFVPDAEIYLKDSFPEGELELVRLGVFRRQKPSV
jgi:hypothetical protein